jgi:hypothetical protein
MSLCVRAFHAFPSVLFPHQFRSTSPHKTNLCTVLFFYQIILNLLQNPSLHVLRALPNSYWVPYIRLMHFLTYFPRIPDLSSVPFLCAFHGTGWSNGKDSCVCTQLIKLCQLARDTAGYKFAAKWEDKRAINLEQEKKCENMEEREREERRINKIVSCKGTWCSGPIGVVQLTETTERCDWHLQHGKLLTLEPVMMAPVVVLATAASLKTNPAVYNNGCKFSHYLPQLL